MAEFVWHPFVSALLDALVPEDGPRLPVARFVDALTAVKSIQHQHLEPVAAHLAALACVFADKGAKEAADQFHAILLTAVGADALRTHLNLAKRRGGMVPEHVKQMLKEAQIRTAPAKVDKPKAATMVGVGLRKR